jgi:cytochrome P450
MQQWPTPFVSASSLNTLTNLTQTNTVLSTFFLAMARNTHVVKKAQKQLDDVLGGERLPDHSDMDELPYITAIIKETFRWSPPLPIGTPHRLMEDDVYEGMFIPAGTMLVENIWLVHTFSVGTGWLLTCLAGEYAMMKRCI